MPPALKRNPLLCDMLYANLLTNNTYAEEKGLCGSSQPLAYHPIVTGSLGVVLILKIDGMRHGWA